MQISVRQKWIYILLVLFVFFLIWQNADGTGQDANAFFGWLGDVLDTAFDFLDSLFDGSDGGGGGSTGGDGTHST